jgi:hypothetical protein
MYHVSRRHGGKGLWVVIALPLVAIAVSAPAVPAGTTAGPTVRVVSPRPGSTVTGSRVVFRVAPVDFTITAQATAVKPNEGHLHVTLDKRPFVALYTPRFVFKGVAAGPHVLKIEVVNSAHKPIRKPIIVRFSTS